MTGGHPPPSPVVPPLSIGRLGDASAGNESAWRNDLRKVGFPPRLTLHHQCHRFRRRLLAPSRQAPLEAPAVRRLLVAVGSRPGENLLPCDVLRRRSVTGWRQLALEEPHANTSHNTATVHKSHTSHKALSHACFQRQVNLRLGPREA